ncbi:MAG: alcohol dehydrogenase catalytic domain-containing protein, partial [Gluconacetobacter diazotrophicus]|nr:alcohol dehydrogenase catalytic domain-containing protein [Gluconacetobacter diazotrophicus]
MRALVLERKGELALRDIAVPDALGPQDVRIRPHTVGICGSDVHYYTHGAIGSFVVKAPMVLGHEASGVVEEVGAAVSTLKPGDRVCMEPGIPDFQSRATLMGKYNIDPSVRFWATPPVHGCLVGSVVHPAALTFRIPDTVSFGEAAMVEPFAVGMQAAVKARITPGDVAVVTGCGTIGMMVALAALAGGCSRVFVTDVHQPKLDIAGRYPGITPINIRERDPGEAVREATGGWGANLVFEASGSPAAIAAIAGYAAPGGAVVIVGMPPASHSFDIGTAMNKEL